MPLERALDSFTNLVKLASYKELSTTSDDHASLQQRLLRHVPHLHREAKSSDEAYQYWEGGPDWRKYVDIIPMNNFSTFETNEGEDKNSCFTLFSFCDPSNIENEESSEHSYYHYPETSDISIKSSSSAESCSAASDNANSESAVSRRTGGIMKRGDNYPQLVSGVYATERKSFRPALYRPRAKPQPAKHVRFAPTKTEVRIRPLNRMSAEERSKYWWSSEEFDNIKKSMAVLIQPEEMKHLCNAWLANRANDSKSLKNTNSNWWHKYGDSRRGLEHFVCSYEAPQIMEIHTEATYQVLMEQEQQRSRCFAAGWSFSGQEEVDRRNNKDAERIARVYKEYTAWSRDLALASGASDADAVACDFDDSRRKSREYFLLKQIYQNDMRVHRHMPDFMSPQGFEPKGFLNYSVRAATH